MWRWFLRRLEKHSRHVARELELERESAGLMLRLEERERQVTALQDALAHQRRIETTRTSQSLVPLLEEVATPVAQLMSQAHLLEAEGKPVQTKDVLAVARRLVSVLETHGLAVEGQIGALENYDPTRHEPLGGPSPQPGQPVKVRLVGVRYQERMLRRMTVEPIGEPYAG